MSRHEDKPLLEVRNLGRRFHRRQGLFRLNRSSLAAVDDVSFQLHRGEILGIAGETGSGKSTLARLIGQLIEPDQGKILLDGAALDAMDSAARRSARQRIQLIFQDPSATLSPRRTIRQSLIEPLAHFRIGQREERERMAVDALESVGLEASAMARLPHQFSSGQRQRISIARALLAQPDLVIADEAVSSLDVSVQAQILELLARLRRERGIGMLFISHDLAVIRQLADRVGIMFQGQLMEYGPVSELLTSPAHPYTRALLAAVPDPDPTRPRPPPLHRPGLVRERPVSGCAYSHRCAEVLPLCREVRPLPRPPSQDPAHHVKCHLYPADKT